MEHYYILRKVNHLQATPQKVEELYIRSNPEDEKSLRCICLSERSIANDVSVEEIEPSKCLQKIIDYMKTGKIEMVETTDAKYNHIAQGLENRLNSK